jgi:AcrR family transcriptional regulator
LKKVDHEQRRLEVAMAAAKIIAYEGLEALTTRNLARAMGCSIGVPSHYFASKDDIVIAAMNWADHSIEQRFLELLDDAPRALSEYEPFIMGTFPLDEQSDLEWRVRLNLAAYSLTHPVLAQSQESARRERFARLTGLLSELQRAGLARREVTAELLVQNAIDFVTGISYNLLALPLPERRGKLEFVRQYLAALQG